MPSEKELAKSGYTGFHPKAETPGKGVEMSDPSGSYQGFDEVKAGAPPAENKVGKPKGYPKHTGGAWYELSNGEKVQGKDAAEKAEAKLG